MTSVRFVGELPVWLGLGLAVVVAAMSWWYYRRENTELSDRRKWLLPLLRSLAFFLAVMALTGPVLRHRRVIGQLGKVKVYFDASESMTMRDRNMSTGRKLLVAEELGWLDDGKLDASLYRAADILRAARQGLVRRVTGQEPTGEVTVASAEQGRGGDRTAVDPIALEAARRQFLEELEPVPGLLGVPRRGAPAGGAPGEPSESDLAARLLQEIVDPAAGMEITGPTATPATSVNQLLAIAQRCAELQKSVTREFELLADTLLNSQDPSIQAAVTRFDELPRWRRCELELFDSPRNVYSELCQRHDVQLVMLAAGVPILRDAIAPADSTAAGEAYVFTDRFQTQTDLSSGIISTQRGIATADERDTGPGGARTAIVLFTDGQHNQGPSPLQTARVLGSQGVALYCVSYGASLPAPDLAVISLEHPPMVFRKDRVRGVMIVRDRMPPGRPFLAQIRYGTDVLWQQQLVTRNELERRIEFDFSVDELIDRIGTHFESGVTENALPLDFEASVSPLGEESEATNNRRTMRLAVMKQRNRLLIIDGRSRWETRYLRNAFERDEKWQVHTIIAGPGTDAAALPRGPQEGQFPETRDALFEYDLLILGEALPDLFTESEQQWLRQFVELRGGGIIFIDGQRGLLRSWADRPTAPLFPVSWLDDASPGETTSLKLTAKGATISALALQPERNENERFWTQLPAPRSLVNVAALPGSEVLVEADVAGRAYPALVTRASGAGRVLYLAFDETWRWRYKVADMWHQRIWNQLARFVMPRPFAASGEFLSVDTGAMTYQPGDTIAVRIRLLGLDGQPSSAAIADALVWRDGRIVSTIGLKPDGDVPGIYRGQIAGLDHGAYEVSVQASGYSESALKPRGQFVVLPPPSVELDETAANESLLKQMAEQSGGVYLREEDTGRLAELLSPLSDGRIVESETPLWQSYWWFTAIVLLLTIEWTLRKRAGLL